MIDKGGQLQALGCGAGVQDSNIRPSFPGLIAKRLGCAQGCYRNLRLRDDEGYGNPSGRRYEVADRLSDSHL